MDQKQDYFLETLIDLDGFMAEIGEGYWVKIEAKRVEKKKKNHMVLSILLLFTPSTEIEC